MSVKIFTVKHEAIQNPVLVRAANRARAIRCLARGCIAEVASPDDLLAAGAAGVQVLDGTTEPENPAEALEPSEPDLMSAAVIGGLASAQAD